MIQADVMKHLRRLKAHASVGCIRNEDVKKDLKIFSIREKNSSYTEKWENHMLRMDNNHSPLLAYIYQLYGRRDARQLAGNMKSRMLLGFKQ